MRFIRIYLSILLLTLFTAYQVGITMFTHVHCVNGVMLVHSHPNKGKHTHSKTELVVIDRLSVFQTLEADEQINFKPEYFISGFLQIPENISVVKQKHLQVLSLRAPPAFAV